MPLPWIGVLTTPHRPQYLLGTLEALDAAGAGDVEAVRFVFVDGAAGELQASVPPGWHVVSVSDTCRGTRPTLWAILRRAAFAEVPWYLHLEDDIRCARNGVRAMAATRVPPGLGFLSFMKMNPTIPSAPGIHALGGGLPFWGTQAIKVPASSLRRFRDPKTSPLGQYNQAGDVWLGEQLRAGVVLPSIVRHIGAETAIPSQKAEGIGITGERDGHRAGLDYVGDSVDALEVLTPF